MEMSLLRNFRNPWERDSTNLLEPLSIIDNSINHLETVEDKKLEYSTYAYTTRGEFIKSFEGDRLPEIHFITKDNYESLVGRNGDILEYQVRKYSAFYIGKNTVNSFRANFRLSLNPPSKEIGGLCYVNNYIDKFNIPNIFTPKPVPQDKELRLVVCRNCESEDDKMKDLDLPSNYDTKDTVIYLATWHTHPNKKHSSEPSGIQAWIPGSARYYKDGILNIVVKTYKFGDIFAFDDITPQKPTYLIPGGIGLIISQFGISIYRHAGKIYQPIDDEYSDFTVIDEYDPVNETKNAEYTYYLHNWKNLSISKHVGQGP